MGKIYKAYWLTTTKKQKNGLLRLSCQLPDNTIILSVVGICSRHSSSPSFCINVLEEKDSPHKREYTFLALPFNLYGEINVSLKSYQYIGQVLLPTESSLEPYAIDSIQYFDFFVKK